MKRTLPVDAKTASAVAKVIDPILVDLLEMKSHVRHAHWNLRDPNFLGLHRFLDEVGATIDLAIDETAERIRQLGVVVDAPATRVGKENRLPAFPVGELSATEMLGALTSSLQKVIEGIRAGIAATSDKVDEPITADLLTGLAGKMEVQLWLLDSHRA